MASNTKPIIIGCDHAAVAMKEQIKAFLEKNALQVKDIGTHTLDSVDYTDFAIEVATAVSKGEHDRGILVCGTGIGMSIVANKFPGVRAALCGDLFSARMSREHNNANVLVLGGRVIGDILALEIVKTWLETPFEGGRHQKRLDKMDAIDLKNFCRRDLK